MKEQTLTASRSFVSNEITSRTMAWLPLPTKRRRKFNKIISIEKTQNKSISILKWQVDLFLFLICMPY